MSSRTTAVIDPLPEERRSAVSFGFGQRPATADLSCGECGYDIEVGHDLPANGSASDMLAIDKEKRQ